MADTNRIGLKAGTDIRAAHIYFPCVAAGRKAHVRRRLRVLAAVVRCELIPAAAQDIAARAGGVGLLIAARTAGYPTGNDLICCRGPLRDANAIEAPPDRAAGQ